MQRIQATHANNATNSRRTNEQNTVYKECIRIAAINNDDVASPLFLIMIYPFGN